MIVKSLKLSNGQELISRIKDIGDTLVLIKPLTLAVTSQGMGFAPFMMTSDEEEFEINKSKIDVIAKPAKQIEDQYLQAVSGLSIAPTASESPAFKL